jgi:gamma-glutamylcyclotransferase (GGCT)/AIG2-like uncharacterized protein YtfP
MTEAAPIRLFVYCTLLRGERDHRWLSDAAFLGDTQTEPRCTLVDLDFFGALVPHGTTAVRGELYGVTRETIAKIDVFRQVPILFQRRQVLLFDGTHAETYWLSSDQVRGKRRLSHGNWRTRFAPKALPECARAPAPFKNLHGPKR